MHIMREYVLWIVANTKLPCVFTQNYYVTIVMILAHGRDAHQESPDFSLHEL